MPDPPRSEIRTAVDDVFETEPEMVERAVDGSLSAEGRLVALASYELESRPGEVRPVVREAIREERDSDG